MMQNVIRIFRNHENVIKNVMKRKKNTYRKISKKRRYSFIRKKNLNVYLEYRDIKPNKNEKTCKNFEVSLKLSNFGLNFKI